MRSASSHSFNTVTLQLKPQGGLFQPPTAPNLDEGDKRPSSVWDMNLSFESVMASKLNVGDAQIWWQLSLTVGSGMLHVFSSTLLYWWCKPKLVDTRTSPETPSHQADQQASGLGTVGETR